MKIYLARHGDAAPAASDSERPLSTQGRKDVERLAHFLVPQNLQVDYFFHSNKLRAQQTAELLATALHCPRGVAAREGLNPTDLVSPIASEINQFDRDLALVGHMPYMGKLASKLISGYENNDLLTFQTATLACLERMADGAWILKWLLCPELFL